MFPSIAMRLEQFNLSNLSNLFIKVKCKNSSISNISTYKYVVKISKQLYFKQFSLASAYSLVLLDLNIGPYQVLPLRVREDLGSMARKGYSAFPKASALLKHHNQIV